MSDFLHLFRVIAMKLNLQEKIIFAHRKPKYVSKLAVLSHYIIIKNHC